MASSVPVEISLDLSVIVRDEDGFDTVIGSYKKDNDTIWTNVTMSVSAELREQRYSYSARPLDFTLDTDNRLMVWVVVLALCWSFLTSETLVENFEPAVPYLVLLPQIGVMIGGETGI